VPDAELLGDPDESPCRTRSVGMDDSLVARVVDRAALARLKVAVAETGARVGVPRDAPGARCRTRVTTRAASDAEQFEDVRTTSQNTLRARRAAVCTSALVSSHLLPDESSSKSSVSSLWTLSIGPDLASRARVV